MPRFGLGTWKASGKGECDKATQIALKNGYRLIDTAAVYENEEDVGKAISEVKMARDDYYVVTKLDPKNHGYDKALKAVEEQLKKLGLDYVDLYIIHSPRNGKILETWDALIEAKKRGLAKSIGVSNFGVEQLEGIKASGKEMPEVNQIELHVWNHQKETMEYCKSAGIVVMGYCPLARVKKFGTTVVNKIAEELKVSEAQLCIRWALQYGIVTIPKSTNEKRIIENANIFSWNIPSHLMKELDKANEGFKASNSVNRMKMPVE